MEAVVSVSGGRVRGVAREGVYAFLGIPYAAPAVGAARFELPQPVTEWAGVRDATTYGATCPQAPYPDGIQALVTMNRVPGDEYLNVNVWTPDPSAGGLPVLVWIHGGGYSRGSNAGAVADGSAFARDGVVVVSMNYRVGMAGFAVLDGAPANRGLHDQIFALRWVQENVAAFGGDPGNVTLGGLSAGGMSVAALLATPLTQGLFSTRDHPERHHRRGRTHGRCAQAVGRRGGEARNRAVRNGFRRPRR
ncbi:carboxylesterase family protein [Nocardia brasiliensis]